MSFFASTPRIIEGPTVWHHVKSQANWVAESPLDHVQKQENWVKRPNWVNRANYVNLRLVASMDVKNQVNWENWVAKSKDHVGCGNAMSCEESSKLSKLGGRTKKIIEGTTSCKQSKKLSKWGGKVKRNHWGCSTIASCKQSSELGRIKRFQGAQRKAFLVLGLCRCGGDRGFKRDEGQLWAVDANFERGK